MRVAFGWMLNYIGFLCKIPWGLAKSSTSVFTWEVVGKSNQLKTAFIHFLHALLTNGAKHIFSLIIFHFLFHRMNYIWKLQNKLCFSTHFLQVLQEINFLVFLLRLNNFNLSLFSYLCFIYFLFFILFFSIVFLNLTFLIMQKLMMTAIIHTLCVNKTFIHLTYTPPMAPLQIQHNNTKNKNNRVEVKC